MQKIYPHEALFLRQVWSSVWGPWCGNDLNAQLFTVNTCICPANVEFLYMLGRENLCEHPTTLPRALSL